MHLIFVLLLSLGLNACSSGDVNSMSETLVIENSSERIELSKKTPEVYPHPEYQCMLTSHDKIKNLRTTCSGTYLTKNIFLTSASCFNILDGGLDLLKNPDREYEVYCRGSSVLDVRAVAVHPHYYSNRSELYKNYETDLINPESDITTIKYNDVALAWTETANLTSFPVLPTDTVMKMDLSSSDQCRFTGFSTENCNPVSGKGCERQGYESNAIVSMYSCDFGSGDGCFLDSLGLEFSTQSNPLAFSVSVKRGSALENGDVGAGMLCESIDGEPEVLMGVFAGINQGQKKDYTLVNIRNKVGFLAKFLTYTEAEFVDNSLTYRLSNSFKERVRLANEIEAVFTAIPDINFNRIIINERGFDDGVLFFDYLLKNKAKVVAYFRANVIKTIQIEDDSRGFFRWLAGASQVEVGLQGSTVKDGQTVFIRGFNEEEWNILVQN